MARIRTIKPEFWTDEKMALLDPKTRLVFLGLICMADDFGRLIDNIKSLDGMLFPHTDETSRDSLETLATLSRIVRYTSKSGQKLIQIAKWSDHQKVNHPGKEILPAPTQGDIAQSVASKRVNQPSLEKRKRTSRKSQESLKKSSCLIPTTYDQRPTTNDHSVSDETDASAVDSRVNWPAEASELWTQKVTPVTPARCGGILKPVVSRFGWPDTRAGILAYLTGVPEGRTRDLAYFAKEANKWVSFGRMKTTDEFGDLTEWGEYLANMSMPPNGATRARVGT